MITRRTFLHGAAGLAGTSVLGRSRMHRTTTLPVDGVYSYGHSFTMDNYPYAPGQEYAKKVGAALGVPAVLRGRSGSKLLDTVCAVVAPKAKVYSTGGFVNSGRVWAEGTDTGSHVVLLQNVHNDEDDPASTPAYEAGYGSALRLALAAFGAKSKTLAAAATRTGAWSTASYPDRAPGGVMYYTSSWPASMTFTVTGDECHIATVGCDSAYLTYGTFRIAVNGVTYGYYNGTGKMGAYLDSVDHTTLVKWCPVGIRVTGMNALTGTTGAKTITISKSSDDGHPIWVSAVYQASPTPPRVFVGLEPPRNPDSTDQAQLALFNANDPDYRAKIATVSADYPYVTVVDLAPDWDNSTMVATGVDPSNFHPNTAGMEHLAASFVAAIGT